VPIKVSLYIKFKNDFRILLNQHKKGTGKMTRFKSFYLIEGLPKKFFANLFNYKNFTLIF